MNLDLVKYFFISYSLSRFVLVNILKLVNKRSLKTTFTIWSFGCSLVYGEGIYVYLNDSILDNLLPGGLQQGNLSRSISNDLFISFMRALSRSQADFLYCSVIEVYVLCLWCGWLVFILNFFTTTKVQNTIYISTY